MTRDEVTQASGAKDLERAAERANPRAAIDGVFARRAPLRQWAEDAMVHLVVAFATDFPDAHSLDTLTVLDLLADLASERIHSVAQSLRSDGWTWPVIGAAWGGRTAEGARVRFHRERPVNANYARRR